MILGHLGGSVFNQRALLISVSSRLSLAQNNQFVKVASFGVAYSGTLQFHVQICRQASDFAQV